MAAFSAEWLARREAADHAARAAAVLAPLARRVRERRVWRAVDLAAGTGSNVRYLLPRLPQVRHWTIVDHDAALLEVAARTLEPLARACQVTIEACHADLRHVGALPIPDAGLVTASALLDLVSGDWLRQLAGRCRDAGAAALFALTYDGRMAADPPDADDERVRALVNAHQRTDKGFGPALGPLAVAAGWDAFAGWERCIAASDWRLEAADEALQRPLIQGWAAAAREMAPDDTPAFDAWETRRLRLVEAGASRLIVGHLDLAAWLPDGSGPRHT